jgi:hypothetical protein
MAERNRGRWNRRSGVFNFETILWGKARVLDGGQDAPLPPRGRAIWTLGLVVIVLAGVLAVALAR